ncbi:hypothetical protein [Cohnella mopanensis]|uniref:hypothetical protein n=1 Tax=Cohnella mopanensis TaxID=2911966 RepID=UPI001EF972AF|nr:hypothetical protein [Cohnella mopanensis]
MNETEVKDNDRLADWRKRNEEEIAQINEKSAINFYGISGMITAILGAIIALTTTLYYAALAIPLGFITMGIGEILRYLHKISNK